MLGFMYDSPDDKTIEKVIITKECVEGAESPRIVRREVA